MEESDGTCTPACNQQQVLDRMSDDVLGYMIDCVINVIAEVRIGRACLLKGATSCFHMKCSIEMSHQGLIVFSEAGSMLHLTAGSTGEAS